MTNVHVIAIIYSKEMGATTVASSGRLLGGRESSTTRKVFAALLVMLSVNHMIACAWYAVGTNFRTMRLPRSATVLSRFLSLKLRTWTNINTQTIKGGQFDHQ